MKIFRRHKAKGKDATGENDHVLAVQENTVDVRSLAINAKFYRQQVGDGQVRILTVQPGSHLDPISCTMREIKTKNAPSYDAVSYCWTHGVDLFPITVNGFDDFRVPANLIACLRRVRNIESERHVWIDAICINQGDETEKSEQVQQMPKIYGNGWQTLIWLGETEPDFPSCPVRDHGYCNTRGFSSIEHGSMLQLLEDFLQIAEKNSLRPDDKYLLRVWWKRLWCVQEFMLSPRVPKIMIGPHLVAWSDFVAVSGKIINPLFRWHAGDLEQWQAANRKRSLLELLRITSTSFACTDPRDRIFALLGITNDANLSIRADYTKTAEDVYTEATMYLINAENNIDMLLDQRISRQTSSLPTWIPDFMNLKNSTEAGTPDGFLASSEKPVTSISYRNPSVSCGCTGSCLTLRAIRFDRIVRRVAIEAERSSMPRNNLYLAGPIHFYREASGGCNSNTLNGPRCNVPIRPPSDRVLVSSYQSRRQIPRMAGWLDSVRQDSSFLDWLLGTLAVDSSSPSTTKLTRLPQIGLLLLDYLFNGSASLEQAVMYHRRNFVQGSRTRKAARNLIQRHQLPLRDSVLHDLQIALEVHLDVLDKISKTTTVTNVMNKADKLINSSRSHEYTELSHLISTYHGAHTSEQVILEDWEIAPVELTVDVEEASAGVQKSTSGYERVFFKTEDQHLGVGPGDLQEGDEIVMPFGSSRPWVIRSHGDHHVLVGDAFVPGIMTGQLEELWSKGDLEYTDYVLR
jgi:hypothetical protein